VRFCPTVKLAPGSDSGEMRLASIRTVLSPRTRAHPGISGRRLPRHKRKCLFLGKLQLSREILLVRPVRRSERMSVPARAGRMVKAVSVFPAFRQREVDIVAGHFGPALISSPAQCGFR